MDDTGRRRPKILLAECDDASARIVSAKLRHVIPCDVLPTTHGEEALALFTEHEPDLVLLCLRLPPLSGFEVLRRMRASGAAGRSVPVVGLGTCSMASDIEAAVAKGFDAVLPGPVFVPDRLRILLDELLARPRA